MLDDCADIFLNISRGGNDPWVDPSFEYTAANHEPLIIKQLGHTKSISIMLFSIQTDK